MYDHPQTVREWRRSEHERRIAEGAARRAERQKRHAKQVAKSEVPKYKPPKVKKLLSMPFYVRVRMCEAQNWRCPDCGKVMDFDAPAPKDRPTIEHVIPVGLGGADRYSNMVMVCGGCNSRLGGKIASMPEYEALEFVFSRAGFTDMSEAYKKLAREQADELIRIRSDLSAAMQKNKSLKERVRAQNIKANDTARALAGLRRTIRQLESNTITSRVKRAIRGLLALRPGKGWTLSGGRLA